ncbi:MAG: metal-dependent hydrolase [Candidatus Poribacteria bacterium]|nr:metal-dependent hydrolase [Candidatus Poribacteria bacterium]
MFREHWFGGLTAYSTFFIISLIATISVSILYGLPFDWNPTISMDPLGILGCFAIALLFGLWPDVDIKSKSQQIFYTVLFVLNTSLILFLQRYLEAALLGLFAMLPILSKHRGWTHSKISMILLPGVFLVIPIYVAYPNWGTGWKELSDLFDSLLKWESLPDTLQNGLAFYLAGLIGYASHLYLDGILFRSRKAQQRKVRTS